MQQPHLEELPGSGTGREPKSERATFQPLAVIRFWKLYSETQWKGL